MAEETNTAAETNAAEAEGQEAEDQTTDDASEGDGAEEDSSTDSTILADDKAAEGDADDAEGTDSDDADGDGEAEPPNYDDLKVPDGMPVDERALGEFKEVAATMNDGKGLSKEDAQALVDFRAKMVKDAAADWENRFSEWRGELLSDKEIGGDKFKTETVPNVLAAAEKFGGKEAVQLLQSNKMYGENPIIVRMLNRVGETLRADQHARGAAAGDESEDARLRRLYPSHYNEDGSLKESAKGAAD